MLERPAWNARTSAKASSFISGGAYAICHSFFPIPGKTKRLSETGYKILVYGWVLQFWKPPFPLYSQKWGVQAPWTTQGSVSATIWALIWSSGSWNAGVSGQLSTLGCLSWRHWHHQVLQHKSTRHEVTLQHGWRCARNVTACRGGAEHTRLNLQERCSADVLCGCVNSAVSHMCCTHTLKFRCIFQTCLKSFLQLTHAWAWAWACWSLLSAHTWCHANGTNMKLVLLRHVRRAGLRWVSGVSTEKQLN